MEKTLLVVWPAVLAFASKLVSGEWLAWWRAIPYWGRFVVAIVAAGSLCCAVLIARRDRFHKSQLGQLPMSGLIPVNMVDRGDFPYGDLLWRVRIPKADGGLVRESPSSRDLQLLPNPLCPDCRTELDQDRLPDVFLRYRLCCPNCAFKTRIKKLPSVLARSAEKVARRCLEETSVAEGLGRYGSP
jgi:hypothetical protein